MRQLLAKLLNGGINRRDFARRMLQAGFGAVTVESILDTVAVAQGQPASTHEMQFEPFSEHTAFEQWCAGEGIPVYTQFSIPDVRKLELKPWKRLGTSGAIVNLTGNEATDATFIFELQAGARTHAHRYMFEETIFVLDGEGETTVWYDRNHQQTFKWQKNSLFSPPLNVWRQHQAKSMAKLVSFHDLPIVLDLLHNADFVFSNDFVFRDRYNNQPDYFVLNPEKFAHYGSAAGFSESEKQEARLVEGGLIPDINNLQMYEAKKRGAKNKTVEVVLSDNTMQTHISEFEVGTYKRAHRHGPGSQILSLNSIGYTLAWQGSPKYSEAREHIRVDWTEGAMFTPPDRWYHQHFNIGDAPARYMATSWIGGKFWAKGLGGGGRTHRLNLVKYQDGGNMIDYSDEDPMVRSLFEEELKKHGIPLRMPGEKPQNNE